MTPEQEKVYDQVEQSLNDCIGNIKDHVTGDTKLILTEVTRLLVRLAKQENITAHALNVATTVAYLGE